MHWEIFIIPLIALGVWIFSTLFKSEDDKTKKAVGRREKVAGRTQVRRIVTDLDRFLEEARRRREPDERLTAPPPSPSRAPVARPPVRERPARTQEQPRLVTPVIAKEEVLVAQQTAPPPAVGTAVGRPPAREAVPSPPPVPAVRPLPVPQQVRSLLSKPQTAAAAFLLREIFDRPLCKRRR